MPADLPPPSTEAIAHSNTLCSLIHQEINRNGGWISFARFMEMALYAPGLGYYAAGARKFGAAGDFVTAPELSALFGRTLARQLIEITQASAPHILELGAGSGKLAVDILLELQRLDALPDSYLILELSADLRERQRALIATQLPALADRVRWLDALPQDFRGAIIANEVLDAVPVHLIQHSAGNFVERGVTSLDGEFAWADQPLSESLAASLPGIDLPDDYLTEISPAAAALVASLCKCLAQGGLIFIDYGFGAREYYHPQRTCGTLMCHYRHHAHDNPFLYPGLQDITAHVDFTAVADAAVKHGAHFLGYTTQAYFLLNNGILDFMKEVSPENPSAYLPLSAQFQKLTSPAEMGELFKVIALGKNLQIPLRGFERGDFSRLL